MKKIIRLTERDLTRIVKRVISENDEEDELKAIESELSQEEGTPDESKIGILDSLKGFVGRNQMIKNARAAGGTCTMEPSYVITGIQKIDELLSDFTNQAKEIIFIKGKNKRGLLKNLKNTFKNKISNTNVNITESNRFVRRRILNEQVEQLAIAGGAVLLLIIIAAIASKPKCGFSPR